MEVEMGFIIGFKIQNQLKTKIAFRCHLSRFWRG